MKKWKTAISFNTKDETYIRGYPLTQMIGTLTFTESIFLVLKGELPSENEKKMFDAMLTAVVEHGVAPPSVTGMRNILSGGNDLHVGVAGGILAFGKYHGGALEDAMKFFQESVKIGEDIYSLAEKLAKKAIEEKWRVAGYGHKYYKEFDPRSKKLLKLAREYGFYGKHTEFAVAFEEAIYKIKGKRLVMNVDGAIGAIASDMGFDYRLGKGFFIIGRVPGLVAHAFEELTTEKPFRRLDEDTEVEYIGVPPRELQKYND